MHKIRENQGYVMQLQNFSVNDGDGIRTTIFMCGCPLKCLWCCNPEHAFYKDPDHLMTLEEVSKEVSKMALFFRNGRGGITFSGGECTLQQGFLRSMTEHFYDKGYNLAMETCGDFDFDQVEDILKKMDLVFYDLKLADSQKHKAYTGKGNERIIENLANTSALDLELVVRIPAIGGINSDDDNMLKTFEIIKAKAPEAKLEILPYHRFGLDKYAELGLPSPEDQHPMTIPSEDEIERFLSLARDQGIETISFR